MVDMGTDGLVAEMKTSAMGEGWAAILMRPDDVRREKEGRGMANLDALAEMSLESLLYYVLVGDGRAG
jgi:hypothetical protein